MTADTTELAPIIVKSARNSVSASGIIADVTTIGSKTDTPIVEIPQAVSVVTRAQMDQQNAINVGESLRYTAGVYSDSRVGGVLDSVFLRGFGGFATAATAPQMLDGLPLAMGNGWAQQTIDPSVLRSVEVLRGPASSLYGQATPGGIVNMVSKQPINTPYHDVGIQIGNRDRIETSFDFGGPITDNGVWSYRLNGLARRADEQIDFYKQQRIVLAPSLTWAPDKDTTLTLFGVYQNDPDNNYAGWLPAQGTVLPNAAGPISRRFLAGEPGYDEYDRRQSMIGYSFQHRVDNDLTIRQNLRYANVDAAYKGIAVNYYDPFGATSNELNRLATWGDENLSSIAVDSQAEYHADTGPLEHTFIAGLSYQRTIDNDTGSSWTYVPAIDYLLPVYGRPFDAPSLATNRRHASDRIGLYFQDQVHLDRLVVSLGGRQDWSSIDTHDRLADAAQHQQDHALSGRIGATYLFDSGFAPYASYSTSFEPTAGVDAGGEAYKPSKGRQTEIGLRYQPDDWDALFTASLFDIRRTNVSVTNPSNPLYYIQTGQVRSRGAEFEAKLSLTDNLDLIGSYTYLDTTITRDTDISIVGNRVVAVPKHIASLWADYSFTDSGMDGLSVGGGLRYVGNSAGDDANTFRVPSVTLADLAIRYDFGAAHPNLKGWRAAVNVSNLFDKAYVSSCFSMGGCFYGNGRVVTASLHYLW